MHINDSKSFQKHISLKFLKNFPSIENQSQRNSIKHHTMSNLRWPC